MKINYIFQLLLFYSMWQSKLDEYDADEDNFNEVYDDSIGAGDEEGLD